MSNRTIVPKTRAVVAAMAAAAVAEDVADEDEKDDAIAPSKEVTVIAGGKPVLSHPRIHELFPRRDGQQLRVLVDAISKHGQSHPVLLVDRGDCFIIIDGHDTVRVVAYLQSEGNPIHLSYEVYTPQAADPDGAAIECMAVAIRRKLLATSVELTKERKQDAILAYLVTCSQRDVYQSARWVSRIWGCTPSWVIDVRRRAIRSGSLPYRNHYQSEDGNWKVAENTYKDRDAPGVLEADPDVEEAYDIVRMTQATPPASPRIDETEALELIQAGGMRDTKEDAPSKEFGDLKASEEDIKKTGDHIKSEEELLTEWNSKNERPIKEDILSAMYEANLIDIDVDAGEVKPLTDPSKLEAILVDPIMPCVLELGIYKDTAHTHQAVLEAIHPLLVPKAKPKSPRKRTA